MCFVNVKLSFSNLQACINLFPFQCCFIKKFNYFSIFKNPIKLYL